MSDLSELYQELILDHNRHPRHFEKLSGPTHQAEGFNPLCGDHYTISLKLVNDKIEAIGFEGDGCAISKASASLMSDLVQGLSSSEAFRYFSKFQKMLTDENSDAREMGKLEVFLGVRNYPSRIKCATLAWHTLNAALKNEHHVSTETAETEPV